MSLSSFSLAPGHRIDRWHNRAALPVLVIVWLATAPAAAQTPAPTPPAPGVPAPAVPAGPVAPHVITLDDALGLAEVRNEQIAIAEAGVSRAIAGQARARSERMPQLGGSAAYDRTLQSEFSGIFDTEGDEGADFSELPFGQPNAYHVGLSFSQLVWSGGRVAAQEAQARLGRDNATIGLASTRAQLGLDVAQAFYESALADRLVGIAEEQYAQADRAFQQARAQREAGRVSEFELLRAQVDRDTIQPQVVRVRAARDVSYFRLKQLLDLPLDAPIQLAAVLDDDQLPPAARFAQRLAEAEAELSPRLRTAITQAENDVRASEHGLDIVKSQRQPAIALNSLFGIVQYPGTVPTFDDWRTNWTVGAAVSIPIMTGGRIKAEENAAKADIDESRARLQLAKELSDLDTASARAELRAARAEWDASGGTVQQAARAYEIAELRYREGLSTQLELSDSRLLLGQAQVNRARAGRDLQMTRVRYALLPDLPLGGTVPAPTPASVAAQASTPTAASSATAPAARTGIQGGR